MIFSDHHCSSRFGLIVVVGMVAIVGVVVVVLSVSLSLLCVLRFCHRPICDGSELSIHPSIHSVHPSTASIHPSIHPFTGIHPPTHPSTQEATRERQQNINNSKSITHKNVLFDTHAHAHLELVCWRRPQRRIARARSQFSWQKQKIFLFDLRVDLKLDREKFEKQGNKTRNKTC